MRNEELARDHAGRAEIRLRALDVLFDGESWADVVREAQEAVELALKGLLWGCGVDPPRTYDVSDVLLAEHDRLPKAVAKHLEMLVEASRELRRDRELAFYGAPDLTPSTFYGRTDAERARAMAERAVKVVASHVLAGRRGRSGSGG